MFGMSGRTTPVPMQAGQEMLRPRLREQRGRMAPTVRWPSPCGRLAPLTLRLSRWGLALEDVAVQGGVLLPLRRHVFLREDARAGALRFPPAPIAPLFRAHVQQTCPLLIAIHH